MHGNIASLLSQRLGSLRLTDGDRWRPDLRMLGRSEPDVTEIISTHAVPLSNRYSQLPEEDALFPVKTEVTRSSSPTRPPLSTEVLEQNATTSSLDLQEDAYKTRVGDWVDGVNTTSETSHASPDGKVKVSRSMSFAHRLRSRASSLSLRSPKYDFRRHSPQSSRKDAATSRSTSAADSTRGASGASSTTSPRQDSIKSAASSYSLLSSKTSLESSSNPTPSKSPPVADDKTDNSRNAGKYGSIVVDPSAAGIFDASPPPDLGKPLPSPPARAPRRVASHRHFSSLPENNLQTLGLQAPKRPSSAQSWRRNKKTAVSSSYSREMLDILDDEFMQSIAGVSQNMSGQNRISQRLLLEEQDKLCEIKPLQVKQRFRTPVYSAPTQGGVPLPTNLVTDLEVSPTQPSIPRRSSRRVVISGEDDVLLPSPDELDESPILPKRSQSDIKAEKATRKSLNIKSLELKGTDSLDTKDALLSPPLPFPSPNPRSARVSIMVPAAPEDLKRESQLEFEAWRPLSPTKVQNAREAAETALLKIMGALSSLDDVMNVSSINKGMRRVYKENELSILSAVLKNQSPAAWELLEWTARTDWSTTVCDADRQLGSNTAGSYRCMALTDREVMRRLKPMLAERCSSFLRPEMASALKSEDNDRASRFEEALYRIWCFCVIFGSGKQREQDLVGQIDWLKGGELANQSGFNATIAMNLDYDMTSVLVSPPEHFGYCNRGRLSADELYDLTEAWNCLTALLQDYVGKTEQARAHGVFQHSDIQVGDIETEVSTLEEWIFHILSLGPRAVLKLAEHANDVDAGFEAASQMGWMVWAPLASSSSRGSFLREPVCRLYEESVMALEKPTNRNPEEQQRREESRARVATMAEEIRAARCASNFKRIPFTDMSGERPMSIFTTRTRPDSIASSVGLGVPATCANDPASLVASARASAIWMISHPKHSGVWPGWRADSVEEDGRRSGSSSRQSQRRGSPDLELDSAMHNVVAMGFTTPDARKALEKTRRDDGVSVERAVNWLLAPEPTTFLNLDD